MKHIFSFVILGSCCLFATGCGPGEPASPPESTPELEQEIEQQDAEIDAAESEQ